MEIGKVSVVQASTVGDEDDPGKSKGGEMGIAAKLISFWDLRSWNPCLLSGNARLI